MVPIERNIERITLLSIKKEKENHRFRIFLKGLQSKRVDAVVHRINSEVVQEIDCTECGNCCTVLRPVVTDEEIARLSAVLNVTKDSFIEKYTDEDPFDNKKSLKETPCVFLDNKKCSIYHDRPHDCRSFPHIDKDDFAFRTLEMLENSGICPIVFNVLERLKKELRFR
jgi:Fe-S-cluster containining protein